MFFLLDCDFFLFHLEIRISRIGRHPNPNVLSLMNPEEYLYLGEEVQSVSDTEKKHLE